MSNASSEEEAMPLGELLRNLEMSQEASQNGNHVKCPKCNTVHPHKTAAAAEKKPIKVFPSSLIVTCCCSSGMCEKKSGYALGCGHLVCEALVDKNPADNDENGAPKISCPSANCKKPEEGVAQDDNTKITPPKLPLCSHEARVLLLVDKSINGKPINTSTKAGSAKVSEECPVCLEEFNEDGQLLALPCGHIICAQDFQKLGGKLGNDALLTLEDLEQQRAAQVQQLQERFGSTIERMIAMLKDTLDEDLPTTQNDTKAILLLFREAMSCQHENRGTPTFVQNGGPKLVIAAMKRFPNDLELQFHASATLYCLVCPGHQEPSARRHNGEMLIQEGLLPQFYQIFQQATQTVALTNFSNLAPVACDVLTGIDFFFLGRDNLPELKRLTQELVRLMKAMPHSPRLLSSCMNVFMNLAQGDGSSHHERNDLPIRMEIVKAKGAEACAKAMRANVDMVSVQAPAIGALCHLSFGSSATTKAIADLGSIELVAQAMQNHPLCCHVQRNALNFLWSMSRNCRNDDTSIFQAFQSNRIVQQIQDAMSNLTDVPSVQAQAVSAFAAMTAKQSFKPLEMEMVRSGVLDLVAKALYSHCTGRDGRFFSVLAGEAVSLIKQLMADKDNKEVRLALCTSDIIPAVAEASGFINHVGYSMMRGGFQYPPGMDPSSMWFLSEAIPNLSMALGAAEINVIGDDEYDFDDDVDDYEHPLDPPPFDVTQLLDKDLLVEDAPGWYKGMRFCICPQRSMELQEENQGSMFLFPSIVPAVDQEVCIRIKLPFGGRGYLYGSVTKVHDAPTEEEYNSNDSKLRQNTQLSREELVEKIGAAHGQEVTALVSLDSPHLERKERYEPLPDFFVGEKKRFTAVLRWCDNETEWEVKHLSLQTGVDE